MKALLLIAHGSRSASANDEVAALAARLRDAGGYALVAHAFLEIATPTIVQGGAQLIKAGATDITALPYFLAAGKHVADDVPAEVALIQRQHPRVKITVAPHFGAATDIVKFIGAHLQS